MSHNANIKSLIVYCAHRAEPGSDPSNAMKMRLRLACSAWLDGHHVRTLHVAMPNEGSGNQCALLNLVYALDLADELEATHVEIRSSVQPALIALRNVMDGRPTMIPNGEKIVAKFRERLERHRLDCKLTFVRSRENLARPLLVDWHEVGASD